MVTFAYGRKGEPNRTSWRSAGSPVCPATAFEFYGARVSSIPFYSGRTPGEWAGDAWPKGLTPPFPPREMRGRLGSLLLLVMTRCVQWDNPGATAEVRNAFQSLAGGSRIHALLPRISGPPFAFGGVPSVGIRG